MFDENRLSFYHKYCRELFFRWKDKNLRNLLTNVIAEIQKYMGLIA